MNKHANHSSVSMNRGGTYRICGIRKVRTLEEINQNAAHRSGAARGRLLAHYKTVQHFDPWIEKRQTSELNSRQR